MYTCGGGSYCRAGIIRRLGGASVEPMIRHTLRLCGMHKNCGDDGGGGDRIFRVTTVILYYHLYHVIMTVTTLK